MAGIGACGAASDMLERLALAVGQAAALTLLVAEPSQAGERIAAEPLI